MTDFVEEFMQTLGPEVSQELASSLGVQRNVASQMIPLVAPLILGGLKRQMEKRGGADRVNHILNKYGDAGVLEDVGGIFSAKAQNENPDPALGGLLGDSGAQAANMISSQFNIDAKTAMKIIVMLAPIILGALTRKRDDGGTGPSRIAALIDQNGDGSILDDVAGLFAEASGSDSAAGVSELVGSLLGGLSKQKRPR